MRGIKSGYGTSTLPLWAVFNLYVIFICTSIPGLAISPIMGDLQRIFPGTSQLETQFLTLGPNIAAIPFVFLGGWIGTRFNNMKLLNWTCLFYGIGGALFFIAPNMLTLILLSFLIGIAAGIMSPLASAFIADLFGGSKRTEQYGYTSAVLNMVLMLSVIATGYLAKINWRLPFVIYLLPLVPLFFAARFKKYIKEPQDIRQNDADKTGVTKVHYKFSEQVNMPMLVRYCIYYFFITLVIAAISLYVPFRYTDSGVAGDLTSILFLGIMLSGFTLNFCLRILKNHVAVIVMALIAVGFILMVVSDAAVIVGAGILVASYFYGIAQPYYYDKLSVASTRVALTLTLAWFAVMDSIGNVVAPFIIDGVAKVFGSSTSKDPLVAFRICMYMCFAALAVVIIRQIIARNRKQDTHDKVQLATQEAPTSTTAPSANPIPADIPLKKLDAGEKVDYAAKAAVEAANEADKAAEAAARAAQTAAQDAGNAAKAAEIAAEAVEAPQTPKTPAAGDAGQVHSRSSASSPEPSSPAASQSSSSSTSTSSK